MLRQTLEAEGHEKLVANRLGVATQGILVATRIKLLNKIYVATLSKYVATQSKNKPREQVVTEKQEATTEATIEIESTIATKRPIWTIILGSTTQLMK